MLPFLKKLLGLQPADRPAARPRPRIEEGDGRRAWEARRGGRPARRGGEPLAREGASSAPPARRTGPVEEACATCGEPLLLDWGGVCPRCRPKLASPRTMIGSRSDLIGASSLTLGWLVVSRTPDERQRGKLFELSTHTTILTRAGDPGPGGARVCTFEDEFLSRGHALIRRPDGSGREDGFTLEDRKVPAPSANGTFLNARKLAPDEIANLVDGDLIRVGTTELLFKSLWLPPGDRQS